MASLKPNKPSTFQGKRDEFAVRTWLFQVQQYLSLVQVENAVNLDDQTKISFVSSFLTGTAAAWWYTLVASNTAPNTWEGFEAAIGQEFIPFDSVQRSRNKLRQLTQKTSVSSYLSEFRNIVLTIPNMNEVEKVDRFCQGLKPQIRLEVMKAGAQTMNDASKIALNVDSALFGAGMLGFQQTYSNSHPTPMEIGNMEQRKKDLNKNACFKCHEVRCRPWICDNKNKKPEITNTNACGKKSSESNDSDSENE